MAQHKSRLNLIIDTIMFLLMMAIAGIGFLIKYVLLPGFKRNEVYGKNVDLYYAGLDRHQWGTIHLILSFILLFLLALHIILHWKQVIGIFKRMVPKKSWRLGVTATIVFLTLLLGVAPLFIQPTVVATSAEHSHHGITEQPKHEDSSNTSSESHEHHSIEINGHMTLIQVAEKYNMNADVLAKHLSVPTTKTNETLGRLRKQYHFEINDLRDYIETNKK